MTDNILDEDKRLTTISFYVSRLTSSARRLNQHAVTRRVGMPRFARLGILVTSIQRTLLAEYYMTRTLPNFAVAVAVGLSVWLSAGSCAFAAETLQFNRDIRPILSQNCFQCHGPDEKSREGDFRIDVRESALAKADSGGRPIVPGDLARSELIQRVETDDTSELMPPPDSHKKLSTAQKQTLRQWISEGAKFERHWSFVLPRRQTPPTVKNTTWRQNPIDHFILARLERENLSPSPEVNRETLIRRVTLDLTGLPATPEEVEAFVRNTQPRAYERLVDRLMSTTAYAERRAQNWLDLARYADTRGFADDKARQIWPYRDWVIRALDQNMPFDQFTIEQLAGDLLPNATDQQRLATAFHRNAPQAKGQTYPVEEYRIKGVVDRVNTTGRVWLGLTMNCAECHDHKFDPVTQRDYYALFAIFNNIEHSGSGFAQGGPHMKYKYLPPEQTKERTRIEAELVVARKSLPTAKLPTGDKNLVGKWERPTIVADATQFTVTGDLTITAKISTTQTVADIVSKYDWRGKQRSYIFGIGGEGDKNGVPGHLFAWISSQPDPYAGVEIHGSQKVNDGREHHVAFSFDAGTSVRLFVDGIEDKSARVIGAVPKSIAKSNRRLAIGSGYNNSPNPDSYRFEGSLSDVRIYDQAFGGNAKLGKAGEKVARLEAALAKLGKQGGNTSSVPIMRERAKPRETFIHVRGNFLNHGEQMFPAAPAMFGLDKSDQPRNRLQFARWLVNGKNPLVARVVVNRYWQSYFGHGLVHTSDDFGAQGSTPTHPELLDWLAREFVESGWDMKRIHRLIVTSATYRQSTRITPELEKRDPQNLLLTRMPRVRLPAEQIRDQALAFGGLLVNKVGGASVFPRHPKNYWQQHALPGNWTDSKGDDRHRRTIYTYWRRMALHPSLEVLNAPARETCVARRDISNVPTQALVLLNDPIFSEAASALAARVIREVDGSDTARLERAFRIVLARVPHDNERTKFLTFVDSQREGLKKDQAAIAALAGEPKTPAATDRAVWTLVCSVLLNLDETITRP